MIEDNGFDITSNPLFVPNDWLMACARTKQETINDLRKQVQEKDAFLDSLDKTRKILLQQRDEHKKMRHLLEHKVGEQENLIASLRTVNLEVAKKVAQMKTLRDAAYLAIQMLKTGQSDERDVAIELLEEALKL
jgi:hypothetical protein